MIDFLNGDLILVHRRTGLLPRAIRWFEGSYWNHTAIFVHINGVPSVVEALGKGVVAMPFSRWIEDYRQKNADFKVKRPVYTTKAIEAATLTHSKGLSRAMSIEDALPHFLGAKYDFKSLLLFHSISIIIKKILKVEFWLGKTEAKAASSLFCCELAALLIGSSEWWKVTNQRIDDENKTVGEFTNKKNAPHF